MVCCVWCAAVAVVVAAADIGGGVGVNDATDCENGGRHCSVVSRRLSVDGQHLSGIFVEKSEKWLLICIVIILKLLQKLIFGYG